MSNGTPVLWPAEGPSVAPSLKFWITPPTQAVVPSPPMASQPIDAVQSPDSAIYMVAQPNYVVFTGPGLETRLIMNENGDIYANQISGPNAGKSCNLTEGKWL